MSWPSFSLLRPAGRSRMSGGCAVRRRSSRFIMQRRPARRIRASRFGCSRLMSARKMPETSEPDIAIIGGGIAGMASAYHLALAGKRVTLLERGAIGAQASGVNFGGLRTNGRAEAELSLSLRAHELWRKLKTLIGHDCETEFTGHVEICDRADHLATVEKWAVMAN